MVSIVLVTAVGAILNAATFIGGSYLAKSLSGKDQDKERKRHNLALEKYNTDYLKWKEEISNLELQKEEEEQRSVDAENKFLKTDESLKLYGSLHHSDDKMNRHSLAEKEPNFNNYYTPSSDQRNGEVIFTGLTVAGLTYAFSKFI